MSKIRIILNYHFKRGLSQREISRALKVSRYVVGQYITDFKLSGLTLETVNKLSDSILLDKLTGSKNSKDDRYKIISENMSKWLIELKRTGVTDTCCGKNTKISILPDTAWHNFVITFRY